MHPRCRQVPPTRASAIIAGGGRPGTRRGRRQGAVGVDGARRHGTGGGDGYTRAPFGWSVHRSSLPPIPGIPRVKDRAEQLVGKAREAVPEGTFAVGGGLMITALTTYVFLIVANQALPDKAYSGLNAFWGFIFVAGPGLFLPLEQEVGRALAHRRAQGLGGGPLVHRAARLGLLLTCIMAIAAVATAPLYVAGFFHGEW